jgi:hypothetical protein
MLAPEIPPGGRVTMDASQLDDHDACAERNVILYTGRVGFVDTGHLCHCCDDTKNIHDQIVALTSGLALDEAMLPTRTHDRRVTEKRRG